MIFKKLPVFILPVFLTTLVVAQDQGNTLDHATDGTSRSVPLSGTYTIGSAALKGTLLDVPSVEGFSVLPWSCATTRVVRKTGKINTGSFLNNITVYYWSVRKISI